MRGNEGLGASGAEKSLINQRARELYWFALFFLPVAGAMAVPTASSAGPYAGSVFCKHVGCESVFVPAMTELASQQLAEIGRQITQFSPDSSQILSSHSSVSETTLPAAPPAGFQKNFSRFEFAKDLDIAVQLASLIRQPFLKGENCEKLRSIQ